MAKRKKKPPVLKERWIAQLTEEEMQEMAVIDEMVHGCGLSRAFALKSLRSPDGKKLLTRDIQAKQKADMARWHS